MKILVSPSLMCADLLHLGEEVRALEEAGADMLHIDIMDGHFVPNFVFSEDIIKAVRSATNLPLDTHLMIYNPEKYIESFVEAGSNVIAVHQEACKDLSSVIRQIREYGAKPCITINPETSLEEIESLLPQVSMVNIMGVNPGFSGRKLVPGTIEKIRDLRRLIKGKDLNLDIEVDGGVNRKCVSLMINAGANVIVAGRQILFSRKRSQYKEIITFLKELN